MSARRIRQTVKRLEPSRSQWAIMAALAETGQLKRKGLRFFADERAPRSFPFTAVAALLPRGYCQGVDGDLSRVVPTPLCRHLLALKAAQTPPARAPGPANPQPLEARP